MTVTSDHQAVVEGFKQAFRGHPTGVAIVTADAGEGPVALVVSSLFSVSVDPPTLVFSVSSLASSAPALLRAETVVVHLMASDNVELVKLCARSGSERFGERAGSSRLPTGEPYYPAAGAWLRGSVVQRVDVHGSVLVVVQVTQAETGDVATGTDVAPLVYHGQKWYAIDERAMVREKVVPYHAIYGRVMDDEMW